MSTVISPIPRIKQKLRITLKNTKEPNHYIKTQVPKQLQITLNNTKSKVFTAIQIFQQQLQIKLNNTKEHTHYSKYTASTLVTNNTK